MRAFLRKPARIREPLPITMAGVRMGERVLQIGVNEPLLAGALAAKAGLTGEAAIAVTDERAAERARYGAAEAGGLVDVHVTPIDALPFGEEAFDVIVVNSTDGLLASADRGTRDGMLGECHRVLRHGGRIIAIEAGPRTGLAGLLRGRGERNQVYEGAGGTTAALESAGFTHVRLLAEREGFRFTEGLKQR